MTNIPFRVLHGGNNAVSTVTAFRVDAEQPVYSADERHPHWQKILEGLNAGDPNVWELFDVAGGVLQGFRQITDRVSFDGSNILWDGDVVHSVLAEQIGRAIEHGESNYEALAKFWEKLASNPSEHSREQAYDFLAAHKFQITTEGDVVGFKGVVALADGVYRSTAKSQVKGRPSAFVNGRPLPELSYVEQRIGDVVSMPRSEVTHDPSRACERGLHVATHGYAKAYGLVLEIHANPRDIVSVPTQDRGEKVRVHRYKAARVAAENYSEAPVLSNVSEPAWAGNVGYNPNL